MVKYLSEVTCELGLYLTGPFTTAAPTTVVITLLEW